MSDYVVAADMIACHDKTLVANQIDTVTFQRKSVRTFEISSDGAARIYYTTDGSEPTVSGANTFPIPDGGPSSVMANNMEGFAAVVKLISPGTPTYSVVDIT